MFSNFIQKCLPYASSQNVRVSSKHFDITNVIYTYERSSVERPTVQDNLGDLAILAKDGNDDAIQSLIQNAASIVHRWAMVQLGEVSMAEDVTQEVLIRMVAHLPRLRNPRSIQSWLFKTTRNQARDFLREQRRRPETFSLEETKLVSSVPGPEQIFVNAELRKQLVSLLLALPRRQREVFDLVELQGVSTSDAARLLRILPSTVRVNLYKARVHLRERFSALGVRRDS